LERRNFSRFALRAARAIVTRQGLPDRRRGVLTEAMNRADPNETR